MIAQQVEKVLSQIKGRKVNHFFFVDCGGSSALMYPSKFYSDREATVLGADVYNANEFIYRDLPILGEGGVGILCSQEGKTPETVAAASYARKKGATTIALAMEDDTLLERESEFFVKYGHYERSAPVDTSYGSMYLLTAGLLDIADGGQRYEAMRRNLTALEPVVAKAKEQTAADAEAFAKACREVPTLYSLSAGGNYSQSYVFCNCYMMEMQWINAIPIHAGEFFHGPFEIIEKTSPVVALVGLDSTRPMEERARRFCEQYTDNLFLLDAKTYDFMAVEEEYRGYLAPLVFNPVLRGYSKAIAKERNHSLDIRRYMHLFDY